LLGFSHNPSTAKNLRPVGLSYNFYFAAS